MPMSPDVSVIIPTWNRRASLEKTLQAIFSGTFPMERFEVIVSDDGSTDDTAQWIEKFIFQFSNLRYLRNEHSGSPAKVRNAALRIARGDILAFTDDDTLPEKDWLEKGFSGFESGGAVGVEGEIVNDKIPNVAGWVAPAKGKRYFTKDRKGWYGFSLANMFYRKEVLQSVGGLDEAFTHSSCEDMDLAWRVLDFGKIPFCPEARVLHPCKKLSPASFRSHFLERTRHHSLLCRKHPEAFQIFFENTLAIHSLQLGMSAYLAHLVKGTWREGTLRSLSRLLFPTSKFILKHGMNQLKRTFSRWKRRVLPSALFLLLLGTPNLYLLTQTPFSVEQRTVQESTVIFLRISDPKAVRFEMGMASEKKFDTLRKVSEISETQHALAAINLSYFGHPYHEYQPGDVRGYCVKNGQLLKSKSIWDEWMDTLLICDEKGRLVFEKLQEDPKIVIREPRTGWSADLSINISRWGKKSNYALFFDASSLNFVKKELFPLVMLSGPTPLKVNQSQSFVVQKIENAPPRDSGSVLCFSKGTLPSIFGVGKELLIENSFPQIFEKCRFAVSTGPLILKNKKICVVDAQYEVAESKTFVAENKDSGEIILGCAKLPSHVLSEMLLSLGVTEALLLDGSGSSCLVVKNEVLFGGSRNVANALLILPAQP